MHRIIDSHAHYSHNSYNPSSFKYLELSQGEYAIGEGNRQSLLDTLAERGIFCSIEPGVSLDGMQQLFALCKEYPGRLFPGVGVHPTRTFQEKWKDRKKLEAYLADPSVVAVGETGLDYHYPRKEQHRICQMAWFWYQLKLAKKAKLPVILHVRDADEDALKILRLHGKNPRGGVVHCFNRGWEVAREYLTLGYCIGVGGTLLQTNERAQQLCQVVTHAPLEMLLVETDAPFILPDCKATLPSKALRRARNTSLILPKVIEKIAQLKGLGYEEVKDAITQNTITLFRLPVENP